MLLGTSEAGQGDAALAHILAGAVGVGDLAGLVRLQEQELARTFVRVDLRRQRRGVREFEGNVPLPLGFQRRHVHDDAAACVSRLAEADDHHRSEEHTSELQSLMRISYAVFCLKQKQITTIKSTTPANLTVIQS